MSVAAAKKAKNYSGFLLISCDLHCIALLVFCGELKHKSTSLGFVVTQESCASAKNTAISFFIKYSGLIKNERMRLEN